MNDGRPNRGQSREIRRLATLPRHGDELRLSLEQFEPGDGGHPKPYFNARVWWKDQSSGEWRPGRAGLSFRRGELGEVIAALKEAEALMGNTSPAPSRSPSVPRERRERAAPQTGDLTSEDKSSSMEPF